MIDDLIDNSMIDNSSMIDDFKHFPFRIIQGFSIKEIAVVCIVTGLTTGLGVYIFAPIGVVGETTASHLHLTAVGFALYWVVTMLLLWKRQVIWWFAMLLTIVAYGFAIWTMFNSNSYASFLRSVKYGGGLPVEVELHRPDSHDQTMYSTHLVIRTTEALIVYDNESDQIQEFQLSDVRSVKYDATQLHEMEYLLPSSKNPD